MIHRAAGILYITPKKTALYLKRGPGGDAPGAWCFPGGTTEGDETAEQTAIRESDEESGKRGHGGMTYHVRSITPVTTINPSLTGTDTPVSDAVDFTTFVQCIEDEFTPTLCDEHTGYAWAPIDAPPQPLHPGCMIALERFHMDELGVAKAMRDGRLTSPQLYGNVHLFDMRITGTGVAYRGEKRDDAGKVVLEEEFVYRRPDNYLTSEFVERCNGLQVIMMHPKGAVLNSEEFAARTVGAMMLPYIKGDEVWGIAKIYDEGAVSALTSSQMSTSPGVVLGGGDHRMQTEDGTNLLIEGKPSLLDHLAICKQGVWDKGGEPRGVRTDAQTYGDTDMDKDELKKVLEQHVAATLPGMITTALTASLPDMLKAGLAAARTDADTSASAKLDQLLGGMTNIVKRLDAVENRVRHDAEPPFGARKDGESDKDYKDRHDADEKTMCDEFKAKGDSDEDAKKKAADSRKDSEDKEEKTRKDAAEAEEKKKNDAVRADAVPRSEFDRLVAANITMAEQLKSVERQIPRAISDAERGQFSSVQARADEVYSAFGRKAPYPLNGEQVFDYRRRLVAGLKEHSPTWKDKDVLRLDEASGFSVAEEQVFKEAAVTARTPIDLKPGELRAIHRQDAVTGVRTTEFVGNRSFVDRMAPPARYVKRFNLGSATPQANA